MTKQTYSQIAESYRCVTHDFEEEGFRKPQEYMLQLLRAKRGFMESFESLTPEERDNLNKLDNISESFYHLSLELGWADRTA